MNENAINNLIVQFIKMLHINPGAMVTMLLNLVLNILKITLYYLYGDYEDWLDNPIGEAYQQLLEYKNSMKETDHNWLHETFQKLEPKEDETLGIWYAQAKTGVSEKDRVKLNKEQQKAVETQKWRNSLLEKRQGQIEQAEREGKANTHGSIFSATQMKHLIPG